MGWAGALVLSLPVLFCMPQEQLARGGLLLLNGHRAAAGMETGVLLPLSQLLRSSALAPETRLLLEGCFFIYVTP